MAVLINNYNNGPWIGACVDSVLAQTRPADEVVVYDDGSTDGSLEILRGYGDRLLLIEGRRDRPEWAPRQRQGRAIEEAFARTTSARVHLLDGDDAYLPGRLEAYEMAWAKRPEVVLVQAPMVLVDEAGSRVGKSDVVRFNSDDWRETYYDRANLEVYYPTSALAFRRDYMLRRLPLDFSDGVNAYADMRLSLPSVWYGPVETLTEPQTLYRLRADSLSAQEGTRGRAVQLRLRKACFDLLAAQHGQRSFPAWKLSDYWRGELRRRMPFGLGDRLAGWTWLLRKRMSMKKAGEVR